MAYNEVSAYDIFRPIRLTVIDTAVLLGALVADRLGEPAGRVITTVATVYAALFALTLGFLTLGWLARALGRNLYAAFTRVFSLGPSVPHTEASSPLATHPPHLPSIHPK